MKIYILKDRDNKGVNITPEILHALFPIKRVAYIRAIHVTSSKNKVLITAKTIKRNTFTALLSNNQILTAVLDTSLFAIGDITEGRKMAVTLKSLVKEKSMNVPNSMRIFQYEGKLHRIIVEEEGE